MSKTDWPALLAAGMHPMSLPELENKALQGGLATDRRLELFSRLTAYLQAVIETGCRAEAWIDGSFMTTKPDPSDIDIALFIYPDSLGDMPQDAQIMLEALCDRPSAMERYGLDLYVEYFGQFHRAAYWRGVFGFCHDDTTPKGIAALQLSP